MRKRPLGKTGLEVSELALGTWGLSGDAYGPVVDAEVDRTLERALACGVTLYDTADVYGRGAMERRLGQRLPKDGAHIVTKIGTDLGTSPPQKRFDAPYLTEAFARSQERLGREVVDVVLLHNPTVVALRSGEATGFLEDLRHQGKILAWGVSAGSVEVARKAMGAGAQVLELAYNVFLAGDLAELASDVAQSGVGVLARSVLAHGLLTGHWSPEREFSPGDHRAQRWTPDELRKRIGQLDVLRPLVTGQIVSLRAAALRFVLSNQLVASAVLGPRSVAQLDQLVREAGAPPYVVDTALAQLSARLKSRGIVG